MPARFPPSRSEIVCLSRRSAAAWLLALGLLWILLGATGFTSRDPDSALHAAIVARSYERPVVEWIAPSWGGEWNRTDLYREHPAGIFLPPSVLARMGYPPWQAAYAMNALYQVLTVMLVCRLGALMVPIREARVLSWILLLVPIAFTYRIRANHEQAIVLLVLLALYALERSRTRRAWTAGVAAAACLALLVKGVFVLPLLASCAAWLLLRPTGTRATAMPWLGVALAGGAALGLALLYEVAYREVTSDTFFGFYLRQQLGLAAEAEGAVVPQKLGNLLWYISRVLWFAFPWSLVLIGAAILRPVVREQGYSSFVVPAAAAALVWPLMFALSDRRADRYIFPAYFLVGMAGAWIGLQRSPAFQRFAGWVGRAYPYEQVLIWLVAALLSILATLGGLPRVR